MRGLPDVARDERFRTRRWDAVFLGSALPGLIAAVRVAMAGHRVLVLEEETGPADLRGMREPFLTNGAEVDGVLGRCLQELGIPLIDRRRIEGDSPTVQVVLPDARVDVGEPRWTAEELEAWNLAPAAEARALVEALVEAATAERDALLRAAVVRAPRRLARQGRRSPSVAAAGTGRAPTPRPTRGLPAEVDAAQGPLAVFFEAQLRALSNLGESRPPPEARARLLGGALASHAVWGGGEGGLRELLRKRIRALYGEFRAISGPFRLVAAAQQPGVALDDPEEIWVGRALVVNAPRERLAAALAQDTLPDWLSGPPARWRRRTVHFRVHGSAVPEAMGRRVVFVRDPSRPLRSTNLVNFRTLSQPHPGEWVDIVASAVVPADSGGDERWDAEMEACLARLLPFAEGAIARQPVSPARWDCDDPLPDPPPGAGWPAEADVKLSARPPTFELDRARVAALGFEGDVILGWRAGDAIAAEL